MEYENYVPNTVFLNPSQDVKLSSVNTFKCEKVTFPLKPKLLSRTTKKKNTISTFTVKKNYRTTRKRSIVRHCIECTHIVDEQSLDKTN